VRQFPGPASHDSDAQYADILSVDMTPQASKTPSDTVVLYWKSTPPSVPVLTAFVCLLIFWYNGL